MPRLPVTLICLALPAAAAAQDRLADIPAQRFTLDPAHSSVVFSINHLGLSEFTASFDTVAATLDLDPSDPSAASLTARIGAASLDLPSPPSGFLQELLGPNWFDAVAHPEITYVSTGIELIGETEARIDGRLTIRGQTAPVALAARFNTAFPAGVIEPHARIGFSATATLKRADFGMSIGIPAPGSTFGVGDTVSIAIETEFIGTPPTD